MGATQDSTGPLARLFSLVFAPFFLAVGVVLLVYLQWSKCADTEEYYRSFDDSGA